MKVSRVLDYIALAELAEVTERVLKVLFLVCPHTYIHL